VRPRRRPWETDEEKSPLAKAYEGCRRAWREFDRVLDRKHWLAAEFRDHARTPHECEEIDRKIDAADALLGELDDEIRGWEVRIQMLRRQEDAIAEPEEATP
jgi:chaperonin cofactor prefoldin